MSTSITGDSVDDQQLAEDGDGAKSKDDQARDQQHQRLIDWNVDLLTRLLRQIARQRKPGKTAQDYHALSLLPRPGTSTIEEVQEIIYFGETETARDKAREELNPEAISQLRFYVTSVCAMYRDNPCKFSQHSSTGSNVPSHAKNTFSSQSTTLNMRHMLSCR